MRYLILDEETQIHKSHGRTANPFDERNWIVYRGWKKQGDERCSYVKYPTKADAQPLSDEFLADIDVIVAHNAKFELLYEMMTGDGREVLMRFFARGGRIWCTQLAEYLLRAQDRKYHYCSLDQIVEFYGGRKKIDGMKELWDAGVQTSDIPEELVVDYLIGTESEQRNSGDIGNTELVYLGQLKWAEDQGMLTGIERRMDSLCATTEMEYNGIKVNVEVAKADLVRLDGDLQVATAELDQYTAHIPDIVGFKWSSPVCKSAILYGGTIRYKEQDNYPCDKSPDGLARYRTDEKWPLFDKEPVDPRECEPADPDAYEAGESLMLIRKSDGQKQDVFAGGKKKGEPKFKNVKGWGELKTRFEDKFYHMDGYVDPTEWDIKKTKNTDGEGNYLYTTDGDTMELLGNIPNAPPFLKALSKKTALDKEIGTYYFKLDEDGNAKGMLTAVQPHDHIIHHSLNHTSTVTTRLSASNPNCQNIPRGDKSRVKAMFVSRFGKDGQVAELDYSQLEVVVQGFLTGDKQLIADLLNKVDFHCVRVAAREGCTYEEAKEWCKNEDHIKYAVWSVFRTECKIFSFQRAYGAGASTIALTAGMTVETVKDMMAKEDAMYPGVVKFNADVEAFVNKNSEPFRDPERGYRVFRRGWWQSPTGTKYQWRSWDAPKFLKDQGVNDTFSPPELKNYPVQGTGGELVQLALGQLWRFFMQKGNWGGKALMCNTVHDCVWFDVHKDVIAEVIPACKTIMEAIPHFLDHFFGIDCPVPFPVDAEVGDDMLNLHHFH